MDRIGKLNRRIAFRSPGHGQDDSYGGGTRTYLTSDSIWAGVDFRQVSSDEQLQADQLQGRQATVFTIRYRTGIDEGMEIVYEDRLYKIEAIQPTPDRMYMDIEVTRLGTMWHSSLIDSTGGELVDADETILVWMPGELSQGYESPQLTFS